ncbi:hypothetical protein GLP20_17020 [Photobacterium carnosum]|nr:hypothetical protein [Photobacterium carnosum]
MSMKKIVVVGDKFHDFTNGKEVITMSELELLTLLPDKILDKKHKIILGQGVNSDSINKIISTHRKNVDYCNNLEIDSLEEFVKNKKNINCHKQRNENILIGRSKAIEQSNKYVMSLVIDERCELMVDHQTGQHIQGMLLIEASRQAFIAVTEEWIYGNNISRYYVINNMAINFSNFIFPLPALISFEFIEKEINERRGHFKGIIQVTQNKIICATMDVSFTVYPSVFIYEKENSLAELAVTTTLLNDSQEFLQVKHG